MKTWHWLTVAGAVTLLLLGPPKKKTAEGGVATLASRFLLGPPPKKKKTTLAGGSIPVLASAPRPFDRTELEMVVAALVRSPFNLDITPGTWTRGGCWILADAVRAIYGGELWVVGSESNEVEHFVVRFGKAYVDGDGVQSRAQILQKIGDERSGPRLARFHIGMDTGRILRPEESVKGAQVILQKCARDLGFMLR